MASVRHPQNQPCVGRSSSSRSMRSMIGSLWLGMVLLLGGCCCCCCPTLALTVDDAGNMDFTVATPGHGPLDQVWAVTGQQPEESLFLSASSSTSSCFVAGRSVATGRLIWRRNVCYHNSNDNNDDTKNPNSSSVLQFHLAASSSSSSNNNNDGPLWDQDQIFVTLEQWQNQQQHQIPTPLTSSSSSPPPALLFLLRAWDVTTGALVWEHAAPAEHQPKNAKKNANHQPQWTLSIATTATLPPDDEKAVEDSTATPRRNTVVVSVEQQAAPKGAGGPHSFHAMTGHRVDPTLLKSSSSSTSTASSSSSSSSSSSANRWTPLAAAATNAVFDKDGEKHQGNDEWTGSCHNRILRWGSSNTKDKQQPQLWISSSTTTNSEMMALPVSSSSSSSATTGAATPISWDGASTGGGVVGMALVSCAPDRIQLLLGTHGGGTLHQIEVVAEGGVDNANINAHVAWTSHLDALSHVSAALLLDASHEPASIPSHAHDTNNNHMNDMVSLSSRLHLQYQALIGTLTSSQQKQQQEDRDRAFGFGKIAVLLSRHHCVLGMETSGSRRASIRYNIQLPAMAQWHRMIHGSVNHNNLAAVGTLGGVHGGALTREILILSYLSSEEEKSGRVDWICLEGTSGAVVSQGSLVISSAIVQVIPLAAATTESCRQGALLVLQDLSIISVLSTNEASLSSPALYTHILENSSLKSYGVNAKLEKVNLVGSTTFPGESILAAFYPSREEVVHSPCDVLGDDSLLLKYLNPHLVVVLTSSDPNSTIDEKEYLFWNAPVVGRGVGTQKRKPAGVTQSGSARTVLSLTSDKEQPNLFVNVMDSVSGRIIYRASHSHAVIDFPRPSLLISENWIFYSFTNANSRKVELGVLSLYEGMIDKKGLTPFTSTEQLTSFSSLDARETKPVVLSKTFTIPVAVTALGVTSTRSGISSRHLLLADLDGQIHSVDRKLLDPRRPLGPLKPEEKKEGLLQYNEMIHKISYNVLSYNQSIEGVRSIVTAPTDLESQSLVLAFGGPDIFFTRTSPSKGFDLLPDNFNKIALSFVVIVLVGLLLVMQTVVSKKIRHAGWV